MVRAPSRPFHNPQSTCWSAPDDSRGGLPCRGKTWSQDDLPFCPGGKCRQKYCSHSPRAVLNYPQHTCRCASIHCPERISKQAGQSVRNRKYLSKQYEFFLRHVHYNFKYSFWTVLAFLFSSRKENVGFSKKNESNFFYCLSEHFCNLVIFFFGSSWMS